MNPFVVFLVLVPLLVTLILWGGAALWSISNGLTGEAIAMHLIFGGIAIALGYLLVRSSRGPVLNDKPIEHLELAAKRKLTSNILVVTYITLFFFLVLVTNLAGILGSLRNWIGMASVIMALSMIGSGLWEVAQAKTRDQERIAQLRLDELERRTFLRLQYITTRNVLVGFSFVTACLTSFLFWRFNGDRFISTFDFVGFLVLLGSVAFWFVLKGRNI